MLVATSTTTASMSNSTTTTTTATTSWVGRRIDVDGHTATVRYHGAIAGKPGSWLGVEWDDPQRGRHSGTFAGVAYFSARCPGAGSFVAASKPGIDPGRSFLAALHEKYLDGAPTADSTLVLGSSDGAVTVETVGWDKIRRKQSRLESLREVGLAGMRIAVAAAASDMPDVSDVSDRDTKTDANANADAVGRQIARLCASMVDLDLSRNLLASWSDLARLAHYLPRVETLRLSANRMALPSAVSSDGAVHQAALEPAGAFSRVRQVTLMSTMMSWPEIQCIEPWFTALEELHVGFNHIASIPAPVTGFANLRVLNLESNGLADWTDLVHLGSLPQLASLNVSNNQLANVLPNTPGSFASLRSISLSDNRLASWADVHALNTYPALAEIRLKRNPIAEAPSASNAGMGRLVTLIARVARVTSVNGSPVSARDRYNAELYYLSECGKARSTLSAAEFAATHPRYAELCGIYGEPEAIPVALTSNALKDRLLTVRFESAAAGPGAGSSDGGDGGGGSGKVMEKKLPGTIKVRAVRALVARLFGGAAGSTRLVWVASKGKAERVEELDDDMRELSYYGIASGDTVRVTSA
ncbi:hypothetical protein BC831DRAFT_474025 [Entophlyctis helioformis]|nr:hypothetical protein BC831DRAFT_474025 [Entophlyctis helioformis]